MVKTRGSGEEGDWGTTKKRGVSCACACLCLCLAVRVCPLSFLCLSLSLWGHLIPCQSFDSGFLSFFPSSCRVKWDLVLVVLALGSRRKAKLSMCTTRAR